MTWCNRKQVNIPAGIVLTWAALVVLCTAACADSVVTKERSVTKLAEGVYSIRHKDAPDAFPQGNTLVVIGEREVLVVDTCYLPSSAREDIAQIRQWTSKPVRYVVNTHWHFDHTMGNAEYLDAFPGAVVVAQEETARRIAAVNPGWLERYPGRADRFQKILQDGKNANGKPLTEGEIKELQTAIKGIEPVGVEFAKLKTRLRELTPALSFDRDITFDLGNREVQVKFLGRGNTAGDTVVNLPKERIVATGDLLDHPVPYLGGGFPPEQIETLKRIAALDVQTIVPGHGDVLHDKEFLNMTVEFLETVVHSVDKLLYDPNASKSFEEMQKAVEKDIDVAGWGRKFAGGNQDDLDFFNDFSFSGVVKAAFNKMSGR
jgi:glyoxylase-like metal-dependent hydrolase (beta-lactamase superfamily II)